MRRRPSSVRRVLCALNVERSSAAALSMASLMAERFYASVDALYAAPAVPKFDHGSVRVKRLINEHNAQDRLTSLLAAVERKVCVSSFVTRGDAPAVILMHSQRQSSDLIVMSSSPNRHFSAAPSTIAAVTARAPCAVLTVGDASRPAPLRRILLPIGPAGVEAFALDWTVLLASRFHAEVGVLRIGLPRSGLWKLFVAAPGPVASVRGGGRMDCVEVLAALGSRGIEAYEIEHPGGGDNGAVSDLCTSGAFDSIVVGLPDREQSRDSDNWVSSLRLRTSTPILSVRASHALTTLTLDPSHADTALARSSRSSYTATQLR